MDGKEAGRVRPRRTEKLSEVVAREIVRDIRDLPPATMLPAEAIMLGKYGVGRGSLREALRLLEVQGLIVIRPGPGGGPMVAQVDSVHFARVSSLYYHMSGATYGDVASALYALEPVIARLAAERHDERDLAVLRAHLAHPDDEHALDTNGFHALLAEMSGNPVLTLSARSLQRMFVERVRGLFPPERRPKFEREHRAICQAILDGDGDLAERLTREHMRAYVDTAEDRYAAVRAETVDWH
ncbi:FCD domain-containing protein [Actinosynnema sp. NPDC047251]|uniref:HTH gntR-type domain-containing protein n=1 Tax=Saccharothrix espanaensis (strain ATCC 51144 / DSM 44229 / JCM 9112 / NBRC 15066 / NRRL 15764) TaxID=1179773 RepID=K0JSC8_SACES|nr:FCD domain-containing protein [Saccharothrix espanaensis]CCH28412.1 hypothetical protein BN6_10860 [Saccharothrix espanaensis DSM 44229]